IDDYEWPTSQVEFNSGRRNDPDEHIVDRAIKRSAVDEKLGPIVENMWRDFGQMLLVLVASLPQHVPEKNGPLPRIDQVIEQRCKNTERGGVREGLVVRHFAAPFCCCDRDRLRPVRSLHRPTGSNSLWSVRH